MSNLLTFLFAGIVGLSTLTLSSILIIYLFHNNKKPQNNDTTKNHNPSLSIIIPFFNEPAENLINTLKSIEDQVYGGSIEVILLDDGSSNDTTLHVTNWQHAERKFKYHLKVLQRNTGRKGKALDIAVPLTSKYSEVIMVLDSDTILAPLAIQRATNVLMQDSKNVACCGFIIPTQSGKLIEKFQFFEHTGTLPAIKYLQSKIGKVGIIAGAFSLHRTSAVIELGGWGQWLVEDVAWTWKALAKGYRIVYAHNAVAYTICPSTFLDLFKQRRRWARGKVEAMKAAWVTSPIKSIMLLPWALLWVQISLFPLPLILALPIISNSHVLPTMAIAAANIAITILVHLTLHKNHSNPNSEKLPIRVLIATQSIYYNLLFDTINIPANLLGSLDGIVNRKKSWLTRSHIIYSPSEMNNSDTAPRKGSSTSSIDIEHRSNTSQP
ncbi:glycosyltransferase [Pseudomonas frederiksbergensis]|uniref:glycosyltransferase n=1 Tax=Pseudomonas frederiksbergensis TaxID=104087 RepID=UPI00160C66DD|nr:glycosyltransferase family 2 protein [Pseudomonas frederiksbergensis]